MLGALALVATGFLFAAPTAHAQLPGAGTYGGVTCSYFGNGTGNYPSNNHFLKCVSSTQKTNNVFGTVYGEPSYVKDPLNNNSVTYFFFHSKEDYENYFTGAGHAAYSIPNDTHGFSDPEVTYPFTIVFEGYESEMVGFINYNTSDLEWTTAHETGHHLDYLWRNDIAVPGDYVSETGNKFDDQLDHDIFLLNNKKQGQNWVTRNPCGSGGALVNLWDPTFHHTVCDGSQLRSGYGYSGTNWEILQSVLPYYYTQQESSGSWQELFATVYAKISGNSLSYASTHPEAGAATGMLGSEFDCVRDYVSRLRSTGAEPTSYSNNCSMTLP